MGGVRVKTCFLRLFDLEIQASHDGSGTETFATKDGIELGALNGIQVYTP